MVTTIQIGRSGELKVVTFIPLYEPENWILICVIIHNNRNENVFSGKVKWDDLL